MRADRELLEQHDTVVLAVGPDVESRFRKYFANHGLPFEGIADPDHRIANLYGQEVSLLRLGRLPVLALVGKDGRLRALHYACSMSDLPPTKQILQALEGAP